MNFEQKINNILNKYPKIKLLIKRGYQFIIYIFSKKLKSEGNIERVSPNDEYEYFFGYYDKSPWDINDRYMLCLKVKNTWKNVAPDTKAEILLIDTKKPLDDGERVRILGATSTWNVQQGCMLQWLGPDYNSKIIYNDFRNNDYCSVILDINTMEEKIINFPIYSVDNTGSFALSLDFSRLHSLRPGYGYYNKEDITCEEKIPKGTCVWKVDFLTGKVSSLLEYKDFLNFETRNEMENAVHKVNHIMINPEGNRFMVLHRWFKGNRKYSRLVTCDINGKNMYNLSDDDMVSHCYWKNSKEILAFEHKKSTGNGYYLMKDMTQEYIKYWPEICNDGHPSYSRDGKYIVTDTYPDRKRIQEIKLMSSNENNDNMRVIAKVFSPFKYDNDTRCDLHPRWNYKGDKICFDSVFEGKRRLYIVKGIKNERD